MEIDRYRALLCAIEMGSLSGAAEKLGYTPSGMSRMIAALEEENGFQLLLRERNGVRPTANCETMLPAIRELLFYAERCGQLADQIRGVERGVVTIGTAYNAFYVWLSRLTSSFHQQYPGIQFQILGGYSSELLEMLEKRQVDLCIISQREGKHRWFPLWQDQMMAWLPAAHPLAALDTLPISTFVEEPYIDTYPGMDIDNKRVFQKCGVTPNVQFSTMDNVATYSMVEAGLGISMNNSLNSLALDGGVRVIPLDPPQPIEVGVAFSREFTPAAQIFLAYLKEELPRIRFETNP